METPTVFDFLSYLHQKQQQPSFSSSFPKSKQSPFNQVSLHTCLCVCLRAKCTYIILGGAPSRMLLFERHLFLVGLLEVLVLFLRRKRRPLWREDPLSAAEHTHEEGLSENQTWPPALTLSPRTLFKAELFLIFSSALTFGLWSLR